MFIELVTENFLVALLVWIALYSSDYYLSILASRMYQEGVHETVIYQGGIELTPQFRADVASIRLVSPRWIRALILISLLLGVLWLLAVRILGAPDLFSFIFVGILLLEVTVHLRHFRVLALFRRVNRGEGPIGRMEYPRWLLLDQSAVEFATFSALYLLIYVLTGETAILGGALFCASIALRHRLWGRRERRTEQS